MPDSSRHRIVLVTAIFSAIIVFIALYSSGFQFAVREVKNTAGALFRSVSMTQFTVPQGPSLFNQIPTLRSAQSSRLGASAGQNSIDIPVSLPVPDALDDFDRPIVQRFGGINDVDQAEYGQHRDAAVTTPVSVERPALNEVLVKSVAIEQIEPVVPESGPVASESIDVDEKVFLVRFGFDSAELDESSLPTIRRAIDAIESRFDGVAIVAGYSDPLGSSAYNLKLSKKRAQAVADSLLASGVSGERLRVEGRGAYEGSGAKANRVPPELGRIAQIIIDESTKW